MISKIISDLKANPRQMMILAAGSSFIILVLYINFLLVPQVSGVVGGIMRMNKAQAELRTAQTEGARIPQLRESIESFQEKVDKYENMLPAQQEIPSLLENLSNMARDSGIKIVGITPVATAEDRPGKDQIYKEQPILISAKSGYHELGRFIDNLENSSRFMKVGNIQIKASSASPKKHDVELLVLTYILLKR